MRKFNFKITARDKNTNARTGVITTGHGTILTPGFVPVGTAATVKTLTSEEIKMCNVDVFFVNTYHMLFRPGLQLIKAADGLHKFMNWQGNLMTDSAGFQIFSLENRRQKLSNQEMEKLVRVTERGVFFKSAWDGSSQFLGPKESIAAQQILGADIMISLDHCTNYPITLKSAKEAMMRTNRWALACLEQHQKSKNQALYGVVQGSIFEELRKEAAEEISKLPFEGFAIGSVANGKEPRELVFKVLGWTLPKLLMTKKPIHFLGIGEIEDIILSVEKGIDTLDCVTPTRLGRMGWIFGKMSGRENKFRYSIEAKIYEADQRPLEEGCECYTCQHYSRAYVHHLFKIEEMLGYRLATIHNLWFFEKLMEEIREAIRNNHFSELKREWRVGHTPR